MAALAVVVAAITVALVCGCASQWVVESKKRLRYSP
jgi:hypothetical protein